MPHHIRLGDGSDDLSVSNPDTSNIGARFDAYGRPRQGTTPSPAVVLGTGAGTSPTGLVHTGTDAHGNIAFTSGSTPPSASTIATITFSSPYVGSNPPVVQIEAKDTGGASALYYATCTNSALTIKCVNALPASTAVSFDYSVVGGA
jgi:hypothetical protein